MQVYETSPPPFHERPCLSYRQELDAEASRETSARKTKELETHLRGLRNAVSSLFNSVDEAKVHLDAR
eukprot:1989053-Pleurochrysis_carterae.AAC.1